MVNKLNLNKIKYSLGVNSLVFTKTPKEYLNSDLSKIKEAKFQIDFDKLGN